MQPITMQYLDTQRSKMSSMVRSYWSSLSEAVEIGRPVIYCFGAIPQEIFRAIDAAVFFGENFSAGCAVARVSEQLCQTAESKGYPPELCSYFRTHLGALETGRNPMGKNLPPPDMIAYVNGRCSAYPGWGKAIREYYPGVPVMSVNVPPKRDGMTSEEYQEAAAYVNYQLEEIIVSLDGWKNRRFDHGRFEEAVDNTGKASRAFLSCMNTLRTKPAPISMVDIFIQMFPVVALNGMPEAAEYYNEVKTEIDQRIADGFAAVPGERFRIYWDGIAIWTRLKAQFEQLARRKAVLVASAYAETAGCSFAHYDAAHPIDSITERLLGVHANLGPRAKADRVSRLVTDFAADGIIMQVSRSCKPMFFDERLVIRGAAERTGVPYCEVHGDMADPRLYSGQEIEDRIDAFLERLAG